MCEEYGEHIKEIRQNPNDIRGTNPPSPTLDRWKSFRTKQEQAEQLPEPVGHQVLPISTKDTAHKPWPSKPYHSTGEVQAHTA